MCRTEYFLSLIGAIVLLLVGPSSSQAQEPTIEELVKSVDSVAQSGFLWTRLDEVTAEERRGFIKVFGGRHADGSDMYVCRMGVQPNVYAPGKLSRDGKCRYAYDGSEGIADNGYEVLMRFPIEPAKPRLLMDWKTGRVYQDGQTPAQEHRYEWRPVGQIPFLRQQVDGILHTEGSLTKSHVFYSLIEGGRDFDGSPLYMCRKQLSDGMHPGKYLVYAGWCNIPWGGKELRFPVSEHGFDVLYSVVSYP
jgi:hypothetical protein